jgi:hypothetical protein
LKLILFGILQSTGFFFFLQESDSDASSDSADEKDSHKPSTSKSSSRKPPSAPKLQKSASPEPLMPFRTREEQIQDLVSVRQPEIIKDFVHSQQCDCFR